MSEELRMLLASAAMMEIPCLGSADGTITMLGLTYSLRARTIDGGDVVIALVDPEDLSTVLVREPAQGRLLMARRTDADDGREITLLGHLERMARLHPREMPLLVGQVFQAARLFGLDADVEPEPELMPA